MTVALDRLLGRDRTLDAPAAAALARLLASPTFELLPLRSMAAQIEALPPRARVSVTASPAKGMEVTVDLAGDLVTRGFQAIPHVAARMIRDRAHLADLLARIAAEGIQDIFVVGGDAMTPGEYPDGIALLRAIHEVGPVPAGIGVPAYPDGHPSISDAQLLEALRAKLPYVGWVTTQLCFDPAKIDAWVRARRAAGMVARVLLGIPGVTEPHRLLSISAKIGVRDTRRFLAKNLGLITRVARSGGFYRPDGLLRSLAPLAADPAMGIDGIHLYTFNQVRATEAWRRETLERYRAAARD